MSKKIVRVTFVGFFDKTQTKEVQEWLAKCPISEHPVSTDIACPCMPPFEECQQPSSPMIPPIIVQLMIPTSKGRKVGNPIKKKDAFTEVDFNSPITMSRDDFPKTCPECGQKTDVNILCSKEDAKHWRASGLKPTPIFTDKGYLCPCGWLVEWSSVSAD